MKNILIVDDDKDLVEALKVRLESTGNFVVNTAQNGDEALRFVQQAVPDLIILDVMMPKLDGLTTLKMINAITEKKIPEVIMTGKATMLKEAFQLEGAREFLIKPVNGAELAKKAQELLA